MNRSSEALVRYDQIRRIRLFDAVGADKLLFRIVEKVVAMDASA